MTATLGRVQIVFTQKELEIYQYKTNSLILKYIKKLEKHDLE